MTKIKQKDLKKYVEKVIKEGEEKSGQVLDEPLRTLFKSILIVVYRDSESRTLVEVGKVINGFNFMKEVNYICEGMKCPSDWKLHTKEDINRWIRIQQKKELGI